MASVSTNPCNLLRAYIGAVPVVCLLDSGASVSVLNYKIWKRIRPNAYTKLPSKRHDSLQAADNSAMNILFDIETNVKINGLNIPATFSVVEKLGFNCIIGMDFFISNTIGS
jgi:hypothetical protein